MSRIVAGRFDDSSGVEAALRTLPGEGFERSEFALFFVTPPGQHATYAVGGDSYSDEGAAGGEWRDFDPRVPSPPDRGVPAESVISRVTSERRQG